MSCLAANNWSGVHHLKMIILFKVRSCMQVRSSILPVWKGFCRRSDDEDLVSSKTDISGWNGCTPGQVVSLSWAWSVADDVTKSWYASAFCHKLNFTDTGQLRRYKYVIYITSFITYLSSASTHPVGMETATEQQAKLQLYLKMSSSAFQIKFKEFS